MERIREFELSIIEWIQQFSGNPIVDKIFIYISYLGETYLFIAVAVIIYWLIEKKWAYKFIISFLSSTTIVSVIKVTAKVPRPYQDPSGRVTSIGTPAHLSYGDHSYSFPSGHSQAAAAITTGVLKEKRKWWLWLLLGLNIVLVPFSRLYLGQHFLSDVIVGIIIGVVTVLLVYKLFSVVKREEYVGLVMLPFILGITYLLIHFDLYNKELFQAAGAFAAFAIGYFIETKFIKFDPKEGPWHRHLIKVIIGFAGVIGLQQGLKYILPYQEVASGDPIPMINYILDGIRYFAIALWATAGAMGIFKLLFGRKKPAKRQKLAYQEE